MIRENVLFIIRFIIITVVYVCLAQIITLIALDTTEVKLAFWKNAKTLIAFSALPGCVTTGFSIALWPIKKEVGNEKPFNS